MCGRDLLELKKIVDSARNPVDAAYEVRRFHVEEMHPLIWLKEQYEVLTIDPDHARLVAAFFEWLYLLL